MKPSNKAVHWGALLSFCLNFGFWILSDRKHIGFWQFVVCMGIPLVILLAIAPFMFIAVNALKGKKYLTQWKREDALAVIKGSSSRPQIFLAKLYLVLMRPLSFFLAWLVVSIFFYQPLSK